MNATPASSRPTTVDRKAVFGWTMFDFANSSFTTVMVTAFFSLYFQKHVVSEDWAGGARIADLLAKLGLAGAAESVRGVTDWGSVLWGIAGGLGAGLVMVTAPLMGALADFSGAKKKFLFATYLGCGVGTFLLAFVARPGWVVPTVLLFVIANFCFLSGENFISAFLPEIAPPELMGRLSGIAWGCGYIGGIGSLVLSVAILGAMGDVDPATGSLGGYPYVWAMIGAWFLLAGVPTFLFVKERHHREPMPEGFSIWTIGFHRLARTWRERARFKDFTIYLFAFTIYVSGVTAVINFASIIADEVLKFDTNQLGLFLVVLNVSALFGAFFGGWLLDRIGSRHAIMIALGGWLLALGLTLAAGMMGGEPGADGKPPAAVVKLFWTAGNVVGFSMGMTFASSRALAALLAPEDRSAEFFGLWGLFFKAGGVIGPITFGFMKGFMGLSGAVIGLGVFFGLGFLVMHFVDEKRGVAAAKAATGGGSA